MIQLSNVGIEFGERVLFNNVNLSLNKGQRYGIIGANGSGKSTLLKIICSEILPVRGNVRISPRLTIGVLKQDHFKYENDNICNVVLMGKQELWQAKVEKEKLALKNHLTDEEGHKLAELEGIFADHGGYEAEKEASIILAGLGIHNNQLYQKMSTLSGGYRLRVLLAQCLFSQPDILLLDEPNNHLDIFSIAWLGNYLMDFKGVVLAVSHDHHFINQVSTKIIDIDYEEIRLYSGNYDFFLKAKKLDIERKEIEIDRQEKKKAEMQQFYEHFRAKATKARQAISRKKQLDKMEVIDIIRSSRIAPNFQFHQERPSGKKVLIVNNLNKSYGLNHVLKKISLNVERGERIAVIGPNGIGKSTLLKILAASLEFDSGDVNWGHNVDVGYFAQNQKEQIPDNSTPYDWMYENTPDDSLGTIRNLLGSMLFSGDDIEKNTTILSGGEAARLVFSKLIVQKPNVMLLDEPTNHLDLESIEALINACENYKGTILFVSHNRYFVEKTATKVLELKKEGFSIYQGNYSDYIALNTEDHLTRDISVKKQKAQYSTKHEKSTKKKVNIQKRWELSKELSRLENKIRKREEQIHNYETKIVKLKQKLDNSDLYTTERYNEYLEIETFVKNHEQLLKNEMMIWEEEQYKVEEVKEQILEFDRKN